MIDYLTRIMVNYYMTHGISRLLSFGVNNSVLSMEKIVCECDLVKLGLEEYLKVKIVPNDNRWHIYWDKQDTVTKEEVLGILRLKGINICY